MARSKKAAAAPTPARGSNLTLSVGLVNVAVKLAPLARESGVRGKSLCPTHEAPVQRRYVCSTDGHDVDETVTGFEYGGGYVVGIDRDAHKADRDGTIELVATVDLADVDPLYFERTYLVWPQKGNEAAHDLIASALRDSGTALIGQTVLSTSTRALAIRWSDSTETLVAHALAFDGAIAWGDVGLVADAISDRGDPDEAQVELAEKLLESLGDSFELSDVVDDYNESLRAAIAAAADGKPLTPAVKRTAAVATPDLMDALTASVAALDKPKPKPKAKKPKAKAA